MNTFKKRAAILAGWAAAAFLIVFSRRPGAVLNAQFWAEDGKVWYADAYNRGLFYSLFTPEAGYFQTFSRIIAIASQAFELRHAPLFFDLAAIAVQIITAAFISSQRMARAVPNRNVRVLLAFIYLALPHSWEVIANVTNSQWHLALLAFLVVIAEPAKSGAWKAFDAAAAAIAALTGPFCLLLIPVAAINYWRRREKWTLVLLLILAAGAAVQGTSLLFHQRPSKAELGAGVTALVRIAGRHLFVSPIIGGRGFSGWEKYFGDLTAVSVAACAAGVALVVYCYATAGIELRLMILFSALIFAAALISPAVSPDRPQWEVIASDNTALRYWFIPNLCLFASLIFLALKAPPRAVRYGAGLVLVLSLTGIAADWRNPPFRELNFGEHAAAFETAPVGTKVVIPINPDWTMELVRK